MDWNNIMNTLQERILYLSQRLKLSHIGSNLSCLSVLQEIYDKKDSQDIVILDNAHAHLAHLLVKFPDASNESIEELIEQYGIHCDREAGCDASGGSLGHGLGIGIGYALSDRTRNVYVIVSDGSTQEGSFFESLRIAKLLSLTNLKIYTNFNSYTAVAQIDLSYWEECIKSFGFPVEFRRTNNLLPELEGLEGHYKIL